MTRELPPEFTPGSVLAERFRIHSRHGEGGMASVLLAEHVGLRVRVAIKVLKPELARSSDVVTRFLREARAMARIANEHVVTVMDVGTGGSGIPYFVMEYLDGADFSKLLGQSGPLSIDDVVEYALQALEGIAAAHRAGVVHRDLKPSNLFLAKRPDDFPLVKVLDFGISKHSAGAASSHVELTQPATMLGSPYYMSPEQLLDARAVDVRTDIWSFGVVLYELLTAELPFDGAIHAVLIDAICSDAPRPIRELRASVPPALEAVILRCLAKDREQRFSSVDELSRALEPLANSAACQVSLDRILRRRSSAPPPPPALSTAEPALAQVISDSISNAPTLPGSGAHDTVATGPPTFSDVISPNAGLAERPRGQRRSGVGWQSWLRTVAWALGGLLVGLGAIALFRSMRAATDSTRAAAMTLPGALPTPSVALPLRSAAPGAPIVAPVASTRSSAALSSVLPPGAGSAPVRAPGRANAF